MISYQYTITNKSGDTITFNDHSDPTRVFALQDYPKITRNIKNNELERVGQNGFWDFYSYNGKMSIAFSGLITAPTHQELEQKKALMQKVFAIPIQSTPTKDGYVYIRWTDDDGTTKEIEAKLFQDISFTRKLKYRTTMDFQIQLKGKKNYVVNQSGYGSVVNGYRGYFMGGVLLPTLFHFTTTLGYQNKLSVTVGGIGALPKIRLYGENQQLITNPRILNITTGEIMQVNITLNTSAEWIEIDTEAGTVLNQAGADMSGYVDLGSNFFNLVAGLNELVYLSDQDPLLNLILPENSGTRASVSYKTIYAS